MRSIIEDSLYKSKAGYKGEKMLEHYLGFLSDENYFIFHVLRLTSNDKYFQLDILLISVNMMVIIEVKNISGILLFEGFLVQLTKCGTKRSSLLSGYINMVPKFPRLKP
ncbi:nuclease-related domain-containing protein [Pseudalkalibacillus salsuginis]|uniref:nuclease-related domain-containing protein n=1 Tax=Pseudalkalibacillus salsuginis TaxID=2910972 RepID=UPI00389AE70B